MILKITSKKLETLKRFWDGGVFATPPPFHFLCPFPKPELRIKDVHLRDLKHPSHEASRGPYHALLVQLKKRSRFIDIPKKLKKRGDPLPDPLRPPLHSGFFAQWPFCTVAFWAGGVGRGSVPFLTFFGMSINWLRFLG